MSRRLRREKEIASQLVDELQEEEDKLKLQHERIFGPVVWQIFNNRFKIMDLQEQYFDEAINLIMNNFIQEDVLFRNTKIANDSLSQQSFADRIRFKLREHASIIAVDEGNENCLAGVLVLNPVVKCDFGRVYSRTMFINGKSYNSVMDFINYINKKVDVFDIFQCDIYLRYYLLCIGKENRKQGLGYQLMLTGKDVAQHLNIPVIMGIFNNHKIQKLAKKVGMEKILFEYPYVKWVDKTGELQFCDPGAGNYTCNLMAGLISLPNSEHIQDEKL